MAVDELGRAIVFGTTDSNDFPLVLPLQQRGGGIDGFVSVLDGGGSVLLSSTWIGGRGDDRIASLTLRGGQMIVVAASTDVASLFPGANVDRRRPSACSISRTARSAARLRLGLATDDVRLIVARLAGDLTE